jgi:hypothetical protein
MDVPASCPDDEPDLARLNELAAPLPTIGKLLSSTGTESRGQCIPRKPDSPAYRQINREPVRQESRDGRGERAT